MQRNTPLNKRIVEHRMKVELAVHLENCINLLESLSSNRLLDGLGELMNAEMKRFVRNKLLAETITLLRFYREFPILEAQGSGRRA